MYSQILVPVDLAHLSTLEKALQTAADLAIHYDIPICYVGVTSAQPSALGHTPDEYAQKLAAFGDNQAKTRGVTASTKMVVSHDPTTDVDDALLKAIADSGSDLVIMASHVPGLTDYLWPSNGGKIAGHANASVFVVRG